MNILEALAQQKQKVENGRVLCDNGLLSINDAVFGVALFKAGYDCIDEYIQDIPLDKREQFLKQIGAYDE
jgi:glucokinase